MLDMNFLEQKALNYNPQKEDANFILADAIEEMRRHMTFDSYPNDNISYLSQNNFLEEINEVYKSRYSNLKNIKFYINKKYVTQELEMLIVVTMLDSNTASEMITFNVIF